MEWQHRVLAAIGHEVRPGARVLDFGCGAGGLVEAYVEAGFDAFGCDIALERQTDRLRKMSMADYRLPFPDEHFDLVCSNQVFEHVQNPGEAFAEISRVLRPGGVAAHLFPARYNALETHTHVPLATVLRTRWWLMLWAALGVRNEFQRGKKAREVRDLNYKFLTENTRYLHRREIKQLADKHFGSVVFAEQIGLRARGYNRLSKMPGIGLAYSQLRARFIVLLKQNSARAPGTGEDNSRQGI